MLNDQLQRETVCLILGGGQGSRLFPLTRDRSKPAVPLGGKFRFIDIALSNSINSGLRQIFVLTQHNSASLNNHVTRTYKFDAFSTGFVAILAAEQRTDSDRGWFQGTADAVRQNLRYLKDNSFRNVLIMPGDHLCRINLNRLLELHENRNADVTLAAAVVDREDVGRFRALKLGENNRVLDIVRKPQDAQQLETLRLTDVDRTRFSITRRADQTDSFLAFMGIYLFKKDILIRLIEHSLDQDLGRETLPRILKETQAYSYVFNDYWQDIGTIQSYYEASMSLTADEPPFRFQDADSPIYTHARFLPSAHIRKSSLDGVLVADGAVIEGSHVERSIVGLRTRIAPGCQLSHTIVFGADTYEGENRRAAAVRGDDLPPLGIGPGCIIQRAIIDKNARIGAGCRLTNEAGIKHLDSEHYFIRDGVIIVPKHAVLPRGTVI